MDIAGACHQVGNWLTIICHPTFPNCPSNFWMALSPRVSSLNRGEIWRLTRALGRLAGWDRWCLTFLMLPCVCRRSGSFADRYPSANSTGGPGTVLPITSHRRLWTANNASQVIVLTRGLRRNLPVWSKCCRMEI